MIERHLALIFSLALAGVAPPAPAASGAATDHDWPQWRGPGRDAVSAETGLVDRWGESGPEVLWRIAAGEGFSSVSAAGGRLYTLWDEGGRQLLVALDAATGRRSWARDLGTAFTNHYGNGPRSTPLVDDGVVYAIGTSGILLAAKARDGQTVWQRNLVEDFAADLPSYGYSSSPLIAGDRLVIEAGGPDASFVALHKKSGKVLWSAGNDRPAYSSPIEVTLDGVSQVVFWSAHGLHAVATADGAPLWDFAWETFCPVSGDPLNTGTPLFVAPDRIYLSSGSGAAMIRVTRAAGRFGVEQVWRSEEMRSDVNSALLVDGHIYGFDRGTLKSLDAATGEVEWKARGYERGSLIAVDGKLIVLGEGGNLALLEATPSAHVVRSSAAVLKGRNWTAPSLAGGRLFLRNQEEIVCLDLTPRQQARHAP